jgi:hypothetical protein
MFDRSKTLNGYGSSPLSHISSEAGVFTLLLTAKVVFSFLWQVTESVEQEFPHFIMDQFLLGYKTVVMSIRDNYCFCMRKSVLKFGNQRPEKRLCYILFELTKRGILFLGVGIG